MPLPMVHLGIAIAYCEYTSVPASFYLGNISPDAIHMRKNTDRQDKRRTHLELNEIGDISLLETTYKEYMLRKSDTDWQWFVRGYFAHLLTDYYWLHTIYKNYSERASVERFTSKQKRIIYYQETDQIDYNLYRTKDWKDSVWKDLIEMKSYDFEPLISFDEINFWRMRTIHWFDLISEEPLIQPQYITESQVNDFMVETAKDLRRLFNEWDSRLFEE